MRGYPFSGGFYLVSTRLPRLYHTNERYDGIFACLGLNVEIEGIVLGGEAGVSQVERGGQNFARVAALD